MRLHDIKPGVPEDWQQFTEWLHDKYPEVQFVIEGDNIKEQTTYDDATKSRWIWWDKMIWFNEIRGYEYEAGIQINPPDRFR